MIDSYSSTNKSLQNKRQSIKGSFYDQRFFGKEQEAFNFLRSIIRHDKAERNRIYKKGNSFLDLILYIWRRPFSRTSLFCSELYGELLTPYLQKFNIKSLPI